MDQACANMEISPVYVPPKWNQQQVLIEAAKYGSRSEFKASCAGAYEYALANGYLDRACAHMRDGKKFWHLFEIMAVALKYDSKVDFKREQPHAYQFCKRAGWIDIACAHMKQRRSWTKAAVLEEAAKHSSRKMFQALASGAFKQAYAGGYLDEACAHMPPSEYGFSGDKPANLYHLRVRRPVGDDLFKVGITNRDPSSRIKGMGLFDGVTAEVIEVVRFDSGRDARIAEKRLHRKLSSFRYDGPKVMKNGNTELFTLNVLELD